MLRVPHGAGLHLLRGQEHALEGPDPGALLDPLRRADAVGQAGHGAAYFRVRFKRQETVASNWEHITSGTSG